MTPIKYRPEIDGLRTVAVIPVILFHLGFPWVRGGYLGVDVFFVISGFLITSLILKNVYSNNFSFSDFWLRRIKRIVPALLTMVIGTLIAAYFLVFKLSLPEYGSDGLSAIFSYANFAMRAKGDYWGSKAESSPFLHCWSLSVEEQFYLVYPLLIFLLYKFKVSILKSLVALTALSFFAFMVTSIYYPRTGFYILPTRAWELSAGGLLACFSLRNPKGSQQQDRYWFMPQVGLAIILISFFFPYNINGIGLMTVVPVIGTMLIIAYTLPTQKAGKIFAHPIMVAIGKISYPLYLWHWPIIVIAKQLTTNGELSVQVSLIIIVLTFLLATASYQLIEKPVRNKKNGYGLIISLGIATVFVCTSYIIPLIPVYYHSSFDKKSFGGSSYFINFGVPENLKELYGKEGISGGDTSKGKSSIIVVGDSHGAMWGRQIDDIAKSLGERVSFFTMKGANALESGYQTAILESLSKNKPCLVIICCRWNDRDLAPITEFIKYGTANQINFLLLNQPPLLSPIYEDVYTDVPQFLTYKKYTPKANQPQYLLASNSEEVKKKNNELLALSKSNPHCTYLDIYKCLTKEDSVQVIFGNKVLYWDDDHLSMQGTEILKPVLQKAILTNLNKELKTKS